MTDTAPEEVTPAPTEETLGEKIQEGAQELSENRVIKGINDEIDKVEGSIGEHLHRHHDDEAPPATE